MTEEVLEGELVEAGMTLQDKRSKIFQGEELKEILSELTELEKNFAQILVYQRPRTNAEALKKAGSSASPKNLIKLAYEMQKRPHVRAYIEHLRTIMRDEAGIQVQEIINNARRGIELAFQQGKPREAEPHNRLLAELGGFIKSSNSPATVNQIGIKVGNAEESSLKGEDLKKDIERLKMIAGISSSPLDED